MTRYYHNKNHRNNNKKTIILIGLVSITIFTLTMIFYPQISAQTNRIQTGINSGRSSIVNTFADKSDNDMMIISTQIHELINQQRQQHGLNTLSWNENNARIAQIHSNDMLASGDFSHLGLSDRLIQMGCPYGSENIEITNGYYLDQIPKVTVNDWMNSYGHRENVLSDKFTSEGIGVTYDGNKALVTEDFC